MDCTDFQLVVHDLWREDRLDLSERRDGLDHAAGCATCRRLLSQVRSLSFGLRMLALESESVEAPRSVERSLLEAFAGPLRPGRVPRKLLRWALAGAAAAVLAVALETRHQQGPRSIAGGQPRGPAGAAHEATGARKPAPLPTVTYPRRQEAARASRSRSSPYLTADYNLATNFLPLPGAVYPPELESAQVVRVSLPLSSLADLGLPVDEDAGETTVQAQVLIGEDGTAQAIRFLR